MPKFFQVEKAAYGGDKNNFRNVEFKKGNFDNTSAAEAGSILEIIPVHIKDPPVIQFIAYIDQMSDSFRSSATPTQPYGRTDPYYIWKSSKRSIRVSFSIPSSSVSVALDNLNNLSWFLASLYPTYKDTATATSIAASPMFRLRFSNLICSSTKDGQGLLGVIQGINVNHQVREGFIGIKPKNMGSNFANTEGRLLKEAGFESVSEGKKFLMPKLIKISFNFEVVHDHPLGWDFSTGNWRGGLSAPHFPYDFGLRRDTMDTPSAGNASFDDEEPSNNNVPGTPDAREAERTIDDISGTPGTGAGITNPSAGEVSPPSSEF